MTTMYKIFESLGNELMYQLKKAVKDVVNFKIDSKFLVLASVVAYDMYQGDEDGESLNQDPDDGLSCMDKKSILKLYINNPN